MARSTPPENPVTPEHAELFDGLLKRWLEQMNLSDWRVIKLKKKTTAMAEITEQSTQHRLVKYKIGADFGAIPVDLDSLEYVAIHEALHVRFHEMLEVSCEEGEYNERVMAAEHSTIVVMTQLLQELVRLKRLVALATSEESTKA